VAADSVALLRWLLFKVLLECMQIKAFSRADMVFIRSSLGAPPRRLSPAFLHCERCALHAHRVRCRTFYEHRMQHEHLPHPPDIPEQCYVGQTVTARHPRLRTIHDGDILTAGVSTYMVQFHRAELGVGKVSDTDVAPSNRQAPTAVAGGTMSHEGVATHAANAPLPGSSPVVRLSIMLRAGLGVLLSACLSVCLSVCHLSVLDVSRRAGVSVSRTRSGRVTAFSILFPSLRLAHSNFRTSWRLNLFRGYSHNLLAYGR
jgi:hypothetical protein